jgi:hypothetical protein
MFESIVADILAKSLGKFIELDRSQLSLGVWSGDVVLRDVVLRRDALAALNLPVAIRYGTVGRLSLKVPWKSLRSAPVVVELADVALLVLPEDVGSFLYDDAKEAAAALRRKLEALDEADVFQQMRASAADAGKDDKGFAAKLATTIVANLHVTVSSVHVRFEDATAAGVPFALGLSLDQLTARSAAPFDPATSPVMHKIVQLQSLALYLDAANCQHLAPLADADLRAAMLAQVARDSSPASLHQYVVRPMHAELHAHINDNDRDLSVPKVRLQASLQMIDIELERQQYLDLLKVTESLSAYAVSIKNLKYRPRNSRPFNDPRAWWRYAISATLDDVRERVRRRSWLFISQFRKQRAAYVALYKRTQHVSWLKPLAKSEQEALRKLEEQHSYDDVLLFRAYALAELKTERVKAEQRLDEQRVERQQKSWFARMTSSIKKASETDVKLTDAERDAMYASIGFDQAQELVQLPRDYVQLSLETAMAGFALVLRNGSDTLLRATLADVSVQVRQRPSSLLLEAALQHLRVVDCYRDANRPIVYRAPLRQAAHEAPLSASNATLRDAVPLLALTFENMPLDKRADNAVRLRMLSLDVIADKPFLDRLGAFVVQDTPVDLSKAKERLQQTAEQVRANTRARLESAIATHATLDVDVEIDAPYVLVPEHATRADALALILDFGTLTVRSIRAPPKTEAASGGVQVADDDFYDKFDVSIKRVNVLLAPLDVEWWRDAVQDQLALRLVDDVGIDVRLMMCIDAQEASLPRTRVHGSLSRLAINYSSSRHARLMRIAAAFTAPPAIAGRVPDVAPQPRRAFAPQPLSRDAPPPESSGDVKRKTKSKHRRQPKSSSAKVAAIAEPAYLTRDPSLAAIKARESESQAAERRLLSKRIEVRAEFSIGEVVVVVARDGTGIVAAPAHQLARVRVEGLALRFEQLSFSMAARVELRQIVVDDLLQQGAGPQFERLLSTQFGGDAARSPTNFVDVRYEAITPKHPDYAYVDSSVKIDVSTLWVFVNRNTVSELIRFGLGDLSEAGATKADAAALELRALAADGAPSGTRSRSGSIALAEVAFSSLVGSLRRGSPALVAAIENSLAASGDDADGGGQARHRVRTTMHVEANIGELGLVLNEELGARQMRRLAEFSVTGVSALVDTRSNDTMSASGLLQSIALNDLVAKQAHERYWAILAPTAADEAASSDSAPQPMIEFGYDTFNKRKQRGSYPGWDAAARVRLASMRFVLLYAFVTKLQNFFVNGPILQALVASTASKAKDVAASAAAAAAAAAASPATTRMKLDVALKSFFVQVPETAGSDSMLLLDCGEGLITNAFTDADAATGAVGAEHIRLHLQHVSLSNRKVVGGDSLMAAMHAERFQILRNFDVVVDVVRLLDVTSHVAPTMSVSVVVSRINFFLAEAQYRAIMATLAGNLAVSDAADADDDAAAAAASEQREKLSAAHAMMSPRRPAIVVDEAPAGNASDAAAPANEVMHLKLPPKVFMGAHRLREGGAAAADDDARPPASDKEAAEAAPPLPSVWTTLKFSARLEQVGLALLTGDGIPVGHCESARIDVVDGDVVPCSLASLAFNGIAVDASTMSNSSLKASFQLQSILLLDTRANSSNKFRRMFGPASDDVERQQLGSLRAASSSADAAGASNAQIDVSFERNGDGDAEAAVTVRHLRGFVVPSILYAVQGFFTSVAAPVKAAPAAAAVAVAPGAAAAVAVAPAKAAPAKKRTPTLLAVVRIEKPQLFVLEDETSSESSAVELCIGAIRVDYAVDQHAKQAATVALDKFEVFVTHPQRKVAAADGTDHVPLVRQFDLKLDYCVWRKHADDAQQTQTIGIDTDPIVMLFSYQDTLMMMKIAATLTPPASEQAAIKAAAKTAAAEREAASLLEPDEERNAREAFARFDADGSGSIDQSEFRQVLRAIGRPATRDEAAAMFRSIDSDGSGSIDRNEFMAWWLSAGVAFLDGESESEADDDDDDGDGGDDGGGGSVSSKAQKSRAMRASKELPANAGEQAGGAAAAALDADTRGFEQAVLKCHSVTLTLINDFQGRAQPFAEVRLLNVDVEAKGWSSSHKQIGVGMTATADYFNPRVMMFEPVLEYWTFRVGLIGGGGDETKPATRLAFDSDQRLELNVSHAMVDTMLTAYAHFAGSMEEQRRPVGVVAGPAGATAPIFSPYWLENHTGCDLDYVASADRDVGSGGPRGKRVSGVVRRFVPLAAGARVPVSFGDFNAKLDTLGTHSLSVRFRADGRAIESIPMDSVGMMRFTHPDAQVRDLVGGASLAPEAADVVCLVNECDGSKTITLRSLVELHNGTGDAEAGVPLLVTFRAPSGAAAGNDDAAAAAAAAAEVVVRLAPGATMAVPLAAVHSGVLFARPELANGPTFADCEASDALHMRSLDRQLGKGFYMRCALTGAAAHDGGACFLRVTASRQVQSQSSALRDLMRVTFTAPVSVRNGMPGAVEYIVGETPAAAAATAAAERDAAVPPLLASIRRIEPGRVGSFFGLAPRKSVGIGLRGAVVGWSEDHEPSKLNVKPALLAIEEEKLKKSEAVVELRNTATEQALSLQVIAVTDVEGLLCARVFAPYALVDRTRLYLSFRQSGFSGDNGVMLPLSAPKRDAPFLFSFPHTTVFDGKLCVKSQAAAEWSAPVSLDAVGARANAEARGAPGERDTCLRLAIALGESVLADTKVVTFTYAYVVVNEHDRALLVQQATVDGSDSKFVQRLAPRERAAFHWQRGDNTRRLLQCRFDEEGSRWSGTFAIDDLDEFPLRVRSAFSTDAAPRDSYTLVRVGDGGGSTVVQFIKYDSALPPYCIENDTDAQLRFYQKGCESLAAVLAPRSRVDFMWDEPSGVHEVVIEAPRDAPGASAKRKAPSFAYAFSKIRAFRPIKVGLHVDGGAPRKRAFVFVRALGPTRSLCITHNSHKLRRCVDLNKVEDESRIALRSERERITQEVVVSLAGIGVSVVDSRPIEVLYLALHGIDASLQFTSLNHKTEFRVARLQVDNQLYSTPFPVMLAPNLQNKRARGKSFFHASIVKSTAYTSIDYYTYASFLMQEFDVMVEDSWIFILLQFVNSLPFDKLPAPAVLPRALPELIAAARDAGLAHSLDPYLCDDASLGLKGVAAAPDAAAAAGAGTAAAARKLYFELLHLNPIKVNLSFQMIKGVGAFVDNPLLRTVLQTLVKTVANLDNAPLRFNALVLESVFSSQATLQSQIVAHYQSQGLREALKVVGSADVLGNPVGLFKSLSTGVTDFFYEPAEGIVESPAAFGRGLATGTLSLLKNTIYGSFNTVSKLTAAMDKGVATLSLDDKYIAERKARSQYKPKHAADGVFEGTKDLARGVFDGITGIVLKPVEGAIEGGVVGFGKGLAKGLIGAAVKPVGGVLAFAAKTTAGIKNTTTLFDDRATRQRFARAFVHRQVLEPYDAATAEGAALLYALDNGAHRSERYAFHRAVGKRVVLVSDCAIYLSKLVLEKSSSDSAAATAAAAAAAASRQRDKQTSGLLGTAGMRVNQSATSMWRASLAHVIALELAPCTVVLRVTDTDDDQIPRDIVCPDENVTMLMYTKLAATVKSFAAEHAAELARARAKVAELGKTTAAAARGEVQRRPSVVAKLVEPRSKADWVPDSAAKECQVCKSKFTLVKRKHHCRICARVTCAACSNKRARAVDGDQVRVCDECYDNLPSVAKVPFN